jgi:hypothetical protein
MQDSLDRPHPRRSLYIFDPHAAPLSDQAATVGFQRPGAEDLH